MKLLKYSPFLIILTTFIITCSNNSPYYEKPIKDWLGKNLNDMDSYESVEFIILDSIKVSEYLPELSLRTSNISDLLKIKIDIVMRLIAIDDLPDSKPAKVEIRDAMIQLDNFNTTQPLRNFDDLLALMKLDSILSKKVFILLDTLMKTANLEFLQLESEFYHSEDSMDKEYKYYDDKLSNIGTSLKHIKRDLNDGLLIYHSFRAKNALGAKVINRSEFKLNNTKSKVENAMGIVQ